MPLLATMIDGLLESVQENYLNLRAARHRPHPLDDYTANRVIKIYTEQLEDLWLYEEQLARWRNENLDPNQRYEVERLPPSSSDCARRSAQFYPWSVRS